MLIWQLFFVRLNRMKIEQTFTFNCFWWGEIQHTEYIKRISRRGRGCCDSGSDRHRTRASPVSDATRV